MSPRHPQFALLERQLADAVISAGRHPDDLTRAVALTALLAVLSNSQAAVSAARDDAVISALDCGSAPSHRYLADTLGLSRQRISQLAARPRRRHR